jgi:hypothetical protein
MFSRGSPCHPGMRTAGGQVWSQELTETRTFEGQIESHGQMACRRTHGIEFKPTPQRVKIAA